MTISNNLFALPGKKECSELKLQCWFSLLHEDKYLGCVQETQILAKIYTRVTFKS